MDEFLEVAEPPPEDVLDWTDPDAALESITAAKEEEYRKLVCAIAAGTAKISQQELLHVLAGAGRTTADVRHHVGVIRQRIAAFEDLKQAPQLERQQHEQAAIKRNALARVQQLQEELAVAVAPLLEQAKFAEAHEKHAEQTRRHMVRDALQTLRATMDPKTRREIVAMQAAIEHARKSYEPDERADLSTDWQARVDRCQYELENALPDKQNAAQQALQQALAGKVRAMEEQQRMSEHDARIEQLQQDVAAFEHKVHQDPFAIDFTSQPEDYFDSDSID